MIDSPKALCLTLLGALLVYCYRSGDYALAVLCLLILTPWAALGRLADDAVRLWQDWRARRAEEREYEMIVRP